MMKKKYIIFGLMIVLIGLFVFDKIRPPHRENMREDQVVIVTGAQPEGIAAAVGAARSGAKVYLLDKEPVIGGLFTSGMMSALDINYKTRLPLFRLHDAYFEEFYQAAGNGYNFDVNKALDFFEKTIIEENITHIPNIQEWKPIMKGDAIVGIAYKAGGQLHTLKGDVVIDCSQDAEVARKTGIDYRKGREELGLKNSYAASTLVFSLKDVDWQGVKKYLKNDDNDETNAIGNAAWGYAEMFKYPSLHPDVQMRGLNLSKQDDGSVIVNALLIFNVDPLNKESIKAGKEAAITELPGIVSYMQEHLVGFENSKLDAYATELYIREGVRIVGEETLTGEDVFTHHNYWNKVAYGSYPMDLQASYRGGYGNNLSGRSVYSIPFGVMIPKGVHNLLVASRSSSFDILAHGSSRTVPVLMALGQAAGVSAQYAIEHELSFADINASKDHMRAIQNNLKKQKVDFKVYLPPNKDEKSWAYPYLVMLRKHGFVSGGNKTKFYLDKAATPHSLSVSVSLIKQHSKIDVPTITAKELPEEMTSKDYLNVVNKLLGEDFTTWQEVLKTGIIDNAVYEALVGTKTYTNGHSYALLAEITKELSKRQGIDLNKVFIYSDFQDVVLE